MQKGGKIIDMEELQKLGIRWSLVTGGGRAVSRVSWECRQDSEGLCWKPETAADR